MIPVIASIYYGKYAVLFILGHPVYGVSYLNSKGPFLLVSSDMDLQGSRSLQVVFVSWR